MQTIPPELLRLGFERCCLTALALSEGNQETNLGLDCFHQKLRKLELIVRKLELIVRFEKFVEGGMGQEQKVLCNFSF